MIKSHSKLQIALCTSGEIWGGIETFVLSYARALTEVQGLDFICVLFEEGPLSKELLRNNIKVIIISLEYKYDFRCIMRLRKIFKQEKIDIVHTHGYKANILSGIAAKLQRLKLLKTDHGMLESNGNTASWRMWLNVTIDNRMSGFIDDAVVYVSKDLARRNSKSSVYGEVIYNGIEVNTHAPGLVAEKELSPCNAYRMCVVGRLDEVKGHIVLLKALTQLRDLEDIRLYLFGEGPLEEKLKKYCDTHDLSERVVFFGFKKNICNYLKEMDVMVMPSLHEGVPYSMLEAMLYQIPIIASSVGGLEEILNDHVNALLVPPRDEHSLAKSIRELHDDDSLQKKLRDNAYQKVSSELRCTYMTERYVSLYHKLIEHGH